MRITVSQLRRIIKEEIQRSILREGMLDDSLAPKKDDNFGASDVKAKWFEAFNKKLAEKIKNAVLPEVGKEFAQFMKFNPRGDYKEGRANISVLFDLDGFVKAIQSYVKGGHKGTNEVIDDLLDNYKPNEMKEALPDLFENILELIGKSMDGLGFTGNKEKFEAKFEAGGKTYSINVFPRALEDFIKIEISLG